MIRRSPRLVTTAVFLLIGLASLSAQAQPSNTSRLNVVVNGAVNAAVRIGNTLYVGGTFSRIAPSSAAVGSLVAVSPTTGQTIPGRFPIVDDTINALLPDGSGGYYVGGGFDKVGSEIRPLLVRLTASGQRDPNFASGLGSTARALALAGGHLWVGGNFTSPRNRLLAVDPVSGQARSFNVDANDQVLAIAVSGAQVFVGGNFTQIAGQPRLRLAAFDATTGALLPWNPGADNTVNTLAVDSGIIYAGGAFGTVGGATRARLAAIDASTGTVTSWAPPSMTNTVNQLAVAGGMVYAGGNLAIAGATPRNNAAAFDLATGAITAWNPAPNGGVTAIAAAGSVVYISGGFGFVGGQARLGVVAVDPTSGALTSWDPNLIRNANTIAIAGDGTVVVGGLSNAVGGVVRSNLAAFDLVTGELLPWATIDGVGVFSMAVAANQIYIGGNFTMVNSQPRLRLAAVDATTGALTGWNPGANATVNAMTVANGQLYIGGSFTIAGGQPRSRLASFALDDGQLTSWAPEATNGTNTAVVRVLEPGDGVIYAGGLFTTIGGQPRSALAALDVTTGAATAFSVPVPTTGQVLALARSGSTLFGGGDQSVGYDGVDAITGADTVDLPETSPGGPINALAVRNSILYAGGGLFSVSGQIRRGLASIDLSQGTPTVTAWNPQVRYQPNAIRAYADVVIAVGSFANANPVPATGIAVFEQTSGPPAAPQNFTAQAIDNAASLQWRAAPLGPATAAYVLEVGSTPGAKNLLVLPLGNVTSLNAVAPTGTYYVRIRAVNAAGESEPTSDIRLDAGCTTPPGAPLALQAAVAGPNVTLNWLKGAGNVARYILEVGSGPGLSNLATATIAAPTTTLSAVAPPGTYFIRLRAANACGASAASSEIFFTVGAAAALPGVPGTPTVTVNGSTVSLAWSAPTTGDAPTGYVVEAGTAPGLANLARVLLGPTPSFATSGVPAGTYHVRVRALNAAGIGPASADVTVVVQ